MTISKINNVAYTGIAKVNAVSKASISKIGNQATPSAAIALVQAGTPVVNLSASSLPITISSTGAGRLIVVACSVNGSGVVTCTGVTDNQGQTYTNIAAANATRANGRTYMWYFPNTAAGVTTITATFSGVAAVDMNAYEFSGAALSSPVNTQGKVDSGTSAASVNTADLTTSVSGCVIVTNISCGTGVVSVNSPYTGAFTGFGNGFAYNITTTTVTNEHATFNASVTSGGFASSSAAFKPA